MASEVLEVSLGKVFALNADITMPNVTASSASFANANGAEVV